MRPSYDQSERVVGGTRAVDLRLLAAEEASDAASVKSPKPVAPPHPYAAELPAASARANIKRMLRNGRLPRKPS